MKSPDTIIAELKMLYADMSRTSEGYAFMWDDPLGSLDELISEAEGAYDAYQQTDWAKEEREKHVEDSFDGGSF